MKWLEIAFDLLFPPRATELLVRTASLEALTEIMRVQNIDSVTSLLPYRHPLVHAAIIEAKYRGNERAQRMLGSVLHEYLLSLADDEALSTITVIPIPLSAARQKIRGYNQVEKVAHYALHGLPYHLAPNLLMRTRDTVPQTSLSGSERRENMVDAFVAHTLDTTHTYIVLDDVVTTGTTMNAAKAALKAKGAKRILLLSLAY